MQERRIDEEAENHGVSGWGNFEGCFLKNEKLFIFEKYCPFEDLGGLSEGLSKKRTV